MGFLRNLIYPAGKYKVIGVMSDRMINKRGESLKELFARREKMLRAYIRRSYPSMKYSEYSALPTYKEADRYRYDGKIKDDIGVVLEKETDGYHITLYNLY